MLMSRWFALALLLLLCTVADAQIFPKLTGRVVDAANLLDPAQEAALTNKLAALETASTRQLVVATIPDLGGNDIAEYGTKLGRAWGIGQAEADNGSVLIVAPNERRVRIEAGYGVEAILTDAVSSLIIQNQITPAFRASDYPGGINAGVDAIIAQLQAPPEVAERAALEAARAQQARIAQDQRRRGSDGDGSIVPLLFVGAVFFLVILPMLRRGGGRRGGRRYRRGGGLGSVGSILLWEAANAAIRSGQGGGGGFGGGFGGGGGGFGGGGGGGFSGGGGSFGGGGASGSW